MKKIIAIISVISLVFTFLLCGCDCRYYEERLDDIKDQLYEVRSQMDELEFAISGLKKEIDDFSYEDWRYNVQDMRRAAYEIESIFEDLDRKIDDIE